MRIEKDDNLSNGYRIFGSSDSWDIEEGRLSIRVSDAKILPMSGDDMFIDIYGEGPQQIAEDIMEQLKESNMLKAENESLKETVEALRRMLEKERNKRYDMVNAFKTELEQVKKETVQVADNTNPDPELHTAMKILIARHNETLMENNRLRKRNSKLKQDFESIKGHLRVAQHKLDEYGREKHYSEICIDNYTGQRLCFKDAKVSLSSDGTVTVIGESVDSLVNRIKELINTEKKFKEWQSITLKNLEGYENPKEN